MRMLALGVDHRSRRRASARRWRLKGPVTPRAWTPLAETFPGNELVILSTCNRVEIYLAGSAERIPEVNALTSF